MLPYASYVTFVHHAPWIKHARRDPPHIFWYSSEYVYLGNVYPLEMALGRFLFMEFLIPPCFDTYPLSHFQRRRHSYLMRIFISYYLRMHILKHVNVNFLSSLHKLINILNVHRFISIQNETIAWKQHRSRERLFNLVTGSIFNLH